jgi:hypothetical protein
MGVSAEYAKFGFVLAVEAALELNDVAKATELIAAVDALPPGRHPLFLRAQASRFKARLAQDASEAERHFRGAAGLCRELAYRFYLAVTELDARGRCTHLRPDCQSLAPVSPRLQIVSRIDNVPCNPYATPLHRERRRKSGHRWAG